jgi:hypothetical protein
MKKPFLRMFVLVLTLLGLTSSQLLAQLAIKSVGSVQKKGGPMQVTVAFSQPVDPTTGGNLANYSLGAGVTINTATMLTGLPGLSDPGNGDPPLRGRIIDNQCVILEVTGLGTAKTTLTVSNVKSLDGALTIAPNTTYDFVPSGYSWTEIARIYTKSSDPGWVSPGHREGKVISDSTNGFDIFNNGRAGWAGEDEFTFAYKEVTGDWTFQSRLEFADSASRWSRAGIMVRERLDDGVAEGCQSRYMTAHADPPRAFSDTAAGVVAGNNTYESNARIIDYSGADTSQPDTSPGCGNGQHTSFANDAVGAGGGTPQYPIAWVRLVRAGDTITASWSNDGVTWTELSSRTFDPPLPAKMYWGPAYCAEWGNINAANGDATRSRYYLTQHRWGQLTTPYVVAIVGSPLGFVATVQDLQSKFVKSTLQMWLDDVSVTASSVTGPDATGLSTITYTAPDILPIKTGYSVKIQFNDNNVPANLITKIGTFDVSYVAVPEDYATTTFSGGKGNMNVSSHKMPTGMTRGLGDNSVAAAETELQDGFIDPGTGQPVVSEYDTTPQALAGVVNFTQSPLAAGYFNEANPPEAPYPDGAFPAGAGNFGDTEYALQFYGYAEFKKGAYRMFVNSDDGFKLSIGPNALDVLGIRVGAYDGGRGHTANADPTAGGFDFVITKDGVYPFRLVFENGTGDSSVEWYMLNSAGTRVLINDTGAPVQTYATGRGRAYIKKFLPYPGSSGVVPRPTLTFQIVDDLTTVADSSVKVIVDGTDVTSSLNKARSGGTLTVTYTPTQDYKFESRHTGELIYTESGGISRTNAIDFTIKGFLPGDLPNNSFWIEVEDFDFGKGQYLPIADTAIGTLGAGAYTGGAYDGTTLPSAAALGIDYNRPVGPLNGTALGGYVYRTDIPGWLDPGTDTQPGYFVPLSSKLDAGVANTRPGGVTVTINYNTGWSGGGWYDYTRTIPSGTYNVLIAACHWTGDAADPSYPGTINSELSKVTAGDGTANQTLQSLGTFTGPLNGLTETLTVLRGSDNTPAVVKFGGKTTLRLTVNGGDSDYLVLAPASGVPAKVTSATPASNSQVPRDTKVSLTVEDFSTTVVQSSVKLFFDGVDVTSSASITKPADVTTVSYDPGALALGVHNYELRFTDNGGASQTNKATFTADVRGTPGQFLIEAEDFNTSGTQPAAASTMPYKGNAYKGLNAVLDIDYHSTEDLDTANGMALYRSGDPVTNGKVDPLNDNLGGVLGQDRGATWQMTVNYKIGWTGGSDWVNYTRQIPAGSYAVWAALSQDDGAGGGTPHSINASLALVTSDPTKPNQTTQVLGVFDAPSTGGWGKNTLVPMQGPNTNGVTQVVSLGGAQTLRFYPTGGDFDYLLLEPAAAPLQFTKVELKPGNIIHLEWSGGGVLQTRDSLTSGTWQDQTGVTSPVDVPVDSTKLSFFARIKGG